MMPGLSSSSHVDAFWLEILEDKNSGPLPSLETHSKSQLSENCIEDLEESYLSLSGMSEFNPQNIQKIYLLERRVRTLLHSNRLLQHEYRTLIDLYHQYSIPHFTKAIKENLLLLMKIERLSSDEIRAIFSLEQILREVLSSKWLLSEEIQQLTPIYQRYSLFLLNRAKQTLHDRISLLSVEIYNKGQGIATAVDLEKWIHKFKALPLFNLKSNKLNLSQFPPSAFERMFKCQITPVDDQSREEELVCHLLSLKGVSVKMPIKIKKMKSPYSTLTKEEIAFGYTKSYLKYHPDLEKVLLSKVSAQERLLYQSQHKNPLAPSRCDEPIFTPYVVEQPDIWKDYQICSAIWQNQWNTKQVNQPFHYFQCGQLLGKSFDIKCTKSSTLRLIIKRIRTLFNQLSWRLNLPDYYKMSGFLSSYRIEKLGAFYLKSTVEGMLSLDKLQKDKAYLRAIIEKLDEEAQYFAVVAEMLCIGFFDLSKIGFVPCLTSDHSHFLSGQFGVIVNDQMQSCSFSQLQKLYLLKKVADNEPIVYRNQEMRQETVLNQIPLLKEALSVPWTISCTGYSFFKERILWRPFEYGQDFRKYAVKKGWPLLDLELWDKIPLGPSVIDRLERGSPGLFDWINSQERPVYRRIPPQDRKEIMNIVQEHLKGPKYFIKPGVRRDDALIRKKFAEELANARTVAHQYLWGLISKSIPQVSLQKKPLADRPAKRQKKDPIKSSSLYGVSPSFIDGWEKRFHIALQLFPRLTNQEQADLAQREKRIQNYLFDYRMLSQPSKNPEEILHRMEKLIDYPIFNIIERKRMISSLKKNRLLLLKSPKKLEEMRRKVLDDHAPTLFNAMQVMNPIMADFNSLLNLWRRSGKILPPQQSMRELISQTQLTFHQESKPYLISVEIAKGHSAYRP